MQWTRSIAAVLVLNGALAQAQPLPEYACHPARAGQGQGIDAALKGRISAAQARHAAESVAELEEIAERAPAHGYLGGVLAFELAWKYLEAGDTEKAAERARAVLSNLYVEGARIDQMRAVLAQIAADAQRWQDVVSALRPVVEQQCRPLPDAYRYLLAEAHQRLDDASAALVQIDAAAPRDDAEGLKWRRAALALDCADRQSAACAVRVLRYAQTPGPSAGLQVLVDEHLAMLSDGDQHRPMLDQARAAGLLDAGYRLIPRPPTIRSELKPLKRVIPAYPRAALKSEVQGHVTLEITVAPTGEVINARVVDASPPGVFDRDALDAAEKGRFEPATVNGEPVETTGLYTMKFRLK